MSVEINSLLVGTPEIRHGRLCIVGTGISVHRVAILYKLGNSPEEIVRKYRHLPLAGVYAALAYYHANRAQIDAEIATDEVEADGIEAEWYQARDSRVA